MFNFCMLASCASCSAALAGEVTAEQVLRSCPHSPCRVPCKQGRCSRRCQRLAAQGSIPGLRVGRRVVPRDGRQEHHQGPAQQAAEPPGLQASNSAAYAKLTWRGAARFLRLSLPQSATTFLPPQSPMCTDLHHCRFVLLTVTVAPVYYRFDPLIRGHGRKQLEAKAGVDLGC